MKRFWRCLALGALAGVALSLARAPLGASLVSLPAVGASGAALYRGLALAAIALALLPARVVSAPKDCGALLSGVLAGFALHGLLLSKELEVGGPASLLLFLALLAAGMLAAGTGPRAPEETRPGPLAIVGLALGGAGAAIALESVARGVRLLGLGTPHDDTLFSLTFLAALLAGALAFGPLLTGSRRLPVLAPGLALGALACLYSTRLLGQFSSREGLDLFLRAQPWDLDLAWVGRLAGGALIGGRIFLLPGFVLGAALWGARHRVELASVLGGAALGLVVLERVARRRDARRALGARAAPAPSAWPRARSSPASAARSRCSERVHRG